MPKFCENCGGVVRDDAQYCPNCGFAMNQEQSTGKANGLHSNQNEVANPKRLLNWMKQSEPEGEKQQGTLADLQSRYAPVDSWDEERRMENDSFAEFDDDIDDIEEEELDDLPKKKRGLFSLFLGSFGKSAVYQDEEDDDEDDEEDEYEEDEDQYYGEDEELEEEAIAPGGVMNSGLTPRDYDHTFGVNKNLSTQDEAMLKWNEKLDEEDEEEDGYLIYEDEGGFLKKIVIACLVVILLTTAVFLGVKMLNGREQPVVQESDAELEELKNTAILFFQEIGEVEGKDLLDYGKLYFGNYQGTEEELASQITQFSDYIHAGDLQLLAVESAAITGNIGAVKLSLSGLDEAVAIFEESQFRLMGDIWRFDFAYFASKAMIETPMIDVPDISEDQEAIVATLRAFNDAWIRYVNTGASDVFTYLNPGSSAYSRIANANVNNLTEELLELELKNVTVDGSRGTVEAYEKFKKNRSGEVTIATYRWLYRLVEVDGDWLVDDYTALSTTSPETDPPAAESEVEPEVAPEPVTDNPSVVPEGFSLEGSFSGGVSGAADAIDMIRYGVSTDRLVFDFLLAGEMTPNVPPYEVKAVDGGIMVTLREIESVKGYEGLTLGGLLVDMDEPVKLQDGYSLMFYLNDNTYYRAFSLASNSESSARLVIDFVQ